MSAAFPHRLPRRDFLHLLAVGTLAPLLPGTSRGSDDKSDLFAPRRHFGASLEATDTVIHGAGQDPEAFAHYCSVLTPSTRPTIFMAYLGLQGDPAGSIRETEAQMKKLEAHDPSLALLPQYGLSMTQDGEPQKHYEQDVASGKYDDALEAMCRALKETGRPAFMRIGYEFNGPWNGYQPESYRGAFQRVARALADHQTEAATIWCAYPPTTSTDYYPGDDHVDWWGIDLFDVADITNPQTLGFIGQAAVRGKPVIICESTPRHIGVQHGQADWDRWFAPYFRLIRDRPEIKAFCYIDWDWNKYAAQWPGWGDARVETNPTIAGLLQKELNLPLYQKSPYLPPQIVQ
jgi:hypothetical protein